MNLLLKTNYRHVQMKKCSEFSFNLSKFLCAFFGFRGHLIKLNYVIFHCASKLRENRSTVDIINFIKRLTFASDIPYIATTYCKDFSFLFFYYSIVHFVYGNDLSLIQNAPFFNPNSRLFKRKQDTPLDHFTKVTLITFIATFISVAKRSNLATLLLLSIFNALTIHYNALISVANYLVITFLLLINLWFLNTISAIGKGE